MFQNANPKCANPACPTAFDWMNGGKFFRFRQQEALESGPKQKDLGANLHNVEHFWLCNRCAQMFTLVYSRGQGVVLRALVSDLLADESLKSKEIKVA